MHVYILIQISGIQNHIVYSTNLDDFHGTVFICGTEIRNFTRLGISVGAQRV